MCFSCGPTVNVAVTQHAFLCHVIDVFLLVHCVLFGTSKHVKMSLLFKVKNPWTIRCYFCTC